MAGFLGTIFLSPYLAPSAPLESSAPVGQTLPAIAAAQTLPAGAASWTSDLQAIRSVPMKK